MNKSTASELPEAINIGPIEKDTTSVEDVCKIASEFLPNFRYKNVESEKTRRNVEHQYLSLDTKLMEKCIAFKPRLNSRSAIVHALRWYHDVHHNKHDRILTTLNSLTSYLET